MASAIIGPHGSGKSTLLESLKRALIASEHTIHSISLRDRQRWLPTRFLGEVAAKPNNNRLVIVDGYEQLAWLERLRLMNRCCRATRRIARDIALARPHSDSHSALT